MHKIFVYGTLLSGMGNHARFLATSVKLGDSISPKGFGMVDVGAFPGAIRINDTDNTIKGEVYEVNDEILNRIDHLEGYNPTNPESSLYNRIEVDTAFGTAYMYLFNSSFGRVASIVKNGDWRTHYQHKIRVVHERGI